MRAVATPAVLEAEEPPAPPLDGLSALRAHRALQALEPWTNALRLWQLALPDRVRRGYGRGPGWYAARLREIADALSRAADIIEGIDEQEERTHER